MGKCKTDALTPCESHADGRGTGAQILDETIDLLLVRALLRTREREPFDELIDDAISFRVGGVGPLAEASALHGSFHFVRLTGYGFTGVGVGAPVTVTRRKNRAVLLEFGLLFLHRLYLATQNSHEIHESIGTKYVIEILLEDFEISVIVLRCRGRGRHDSS